MIKGILLYIRYGYILRIYRKLSKELQYYIDEDRKQIGNMDFISAFRGNPGFRSIFYTRIPEKYKKWYRIIAPDFSQIEIYPHEGIGKGLKIYHNFGCVLNAKSIGDYVKICQGVTLGKGRLTKYGCIPIIGNHVFIGANAVIIGGVKIGDYAIIGAQALVIDDVPDNAVVGGVPAKVLYIKER